MPDTTERFPGLRDAVLAIMAQPRVQDPEAMNEQTRISRLAAKVAREKRRDERT